MAFQSGVPLTLWGDCVLTVVFLINRTPSELLSNKTPYEVLTGKAPVYSLLKTFGCLCYASTSLKQIHKFLPRSKACIFLGYPSGYKGYKLMDLERNKVFISRNVLFHEDIFPLCSKAPNLHNSPINSLTPEDTSLSPNNISTSKTQTIPSLSPELRNHLLIFKITFATLCNPLLYIPFHYIAYIFKAFTFIHFFH